MRILEPRKILMAIVFLFALNLLSQNLPSQNPLSLNASEPFVSLKTGNVIREIDSVPFSVHAEIAQEKKSASLLR